MPTSTPRVGDVSIKIATSAVAEHAEMQVEADPGHKILSVGISIEITDQWGQPVQSGHNFVTACAPDVPYGWILRSKDSQEKTYAIISAHCIQIYDPDDAFDIQVFSSSSYGSQSSNVATAQVGQGYTMIGGGASATYSDCGQFITSSKPMKGESGLYDSWFAASKDHMVQDLGSVTAYAIGIMARQGTITTSVACKTSSEPSEGPQAWVDLTDGSALCGGGIDVPGQQTGNLATGFCPDIQVPNRWIVSSHDGMKDDPEDITAYAIGLTFTP